MERGHQWRALAASGDIATSEIGDGGYAGQLRDQVAVAHLQGERRIAEWTMAQGLAMGTYGAYRLGAHAAFLQQCEHRFGQRLAHAGVQLAELVERNRGLRLRDLQDLAGQRLRERVGAREQQAGMRRKTHQGRVDAVDAGARHQADEQLAVSHRGQREARREFFSTSSNLATAGAVAARKRTSSEPASGCGLGMVTVSGLTCLPPMRNS